MDRLQCLQQLLLPQGNSNPIGIATTTFDEELRALVFRGIRATDSSASDSSDHLRLWAWRVLLGVVNGERHAWSAQVRRSRSEYGKWKRDVVGGTPSRRGGGGIRTEDEHRSDISLMKEIEKDAVRTRSELAFFASGSLAQQQMLYVLFTFAKLHPDIGYVQGMNEVLAPILYACGSDPTPNRALEVEADAYHLFASVMTSLGVLYGQTPTEPLRGANVQMSRLETLLRQHDAELWQHLNSVGVTPDLYSFRWYLTLLAREFSMPDTLRIWDALFADPKRFSFLHYVNCALVRSQRSFLLREGFTSGLKRLQNLQSSTCKLDVDHILLEAEQMRQLEANVDAKTATWHHDL